MAIKVPMKVTMTSMTAVRPSARSEKLAVKFPALIQARSLPDDERLAVACIATAMNVDDREEARTDRAGDAGPMALVR